MAAARRDAAQQQTGVGGDAGNQQVKVSWTEEVLVQRAELDDYLLMDAERPAFMTEQQGGERGLEEVEEELVNDYIQGSHLESCLSTKLGLKTKEATF